MSSLLRKTCNTLQRYSVKNTSYYTPSLLCNSSIINKRMYTFKGIYLFPGPGEVDLDDGAEKPQGVPETWTTLDMETNFGTFDENTFPPALEGETLEQYCRRVPNIWSPCSKATDTVDVIAWIDTAWAGDRAPARHSQFIEEALVKIPPESANWHVTYVPDYEWLLKDFCLRARPFMIRPTESEFKIMLEEFEKGVKRVGIGHHFKARTFHEFWEELTGKPLKDIANIPTWEEELEKRIALAKERNLRESGDENIPLINPGPFPDEPLEESQKIAK